MRNTCGVGELIHGLLGDGKTDILTTLIDFRVFRGSAKGTRGGQLLEKAR